MNAKNKNKKKKRNRRKNRPNVSQPEESKDDEEEQIKQNEEITVKNNNNEIYKELKNNLLTEVLKKYKEEEPKIKLFYKTNFPNKINNKSYEKNPNNIKYYNQQSIHSSIETDSNEDEGLNEYKINGYHPVHIGEILLNRYIILQKLGWGSCSTTWMALDTKYKNYVAIKIQKSDSKFLDLAYDEVEILTEIQKHNNDPDWIKSVEKYWKDNPERIKNGVKKDNTQILELLNSFIYHGQNGKHFCLVFEIMGMTLSDIINKFNYKGLPINYVRIITKQILIGLDYLHRFCKIIHTDLKPENIWICLTKSQMNEIKELGKFDENSRVYKKLKKDNTNENDNSLSEKGIFEQKLNSKKKKKKKKKKLLKQKAIKIYECPELDKKYNYINFSVKDYSYNNNTINELIERPRVLSVPKKLFHFFEINKEESNKEQNDNSNSDANEYDINIVEYSKSARKYLKERKKINTDLEYKISTIFKNKIINNIQDEKKQNEYLNNLQSDLLKYFFDLDKDIKIKICHFGKGCYINHHFEKVIQTRQYRAPEIILGINYNETVDIWSLACIVFEMVTGDYLFEPRQKEKSFCKNDDHLAQLIELLGRIPKNFALSGSESKRYFTKDGKLGRISSLHKCLLKDVLIKKYHLKKEEAIALNNFLLPMLDYCPEKRASAKQMLNHPWLKMKTVGNHIMNDWEIEKMNMIEENQKGKILDENINPEFDNNYICSSDESIAKADDEDNGIYKEDEESFECFMKFKENLDNSINSNPDYE